MTINETADASATTAGGVIRLRFAGKCATCGEALATGSMAYYSRDLKKAYCDSHAPVAHDISPPLTPALAVPASAPQRKRPGDSDLPEKIKARYPGQCSACMTPIPKGADAFYIRAAKAMVCIDCTRLEVTLGLAMNPAGAGAARMADDAGRRHSERLLAAYPMLGDRLLENAKPPASVQAWTRGADGERIVGGLLDKLVREGRIEVLHDRVVPGTYSNFDHIVIGPRRMTVIDAKHYRGAEIRTKKVGSDRVLFVDGQDSSYLVDAVRDQRAKLAAVLGPEFEGVVEGSLAFVGAEHGALGTFSSRSISCMAAKEAVARASFSGWVPGNPRLKFDATHRIEIRDRVATAFPPNRR